MPTYDYVCDACGHAFEHFQGISEALLVACPACRKRKLRRLIGAGIGVVFKGSGFYETDYKRAPAAGSKTPSSTEPASPAKDGADASAAPRTDAKPEAGAPAKPGSESSRPAPERGRDAAPGASGKSPADSRPDSGSPPAARPADAAGKDRPRDGGSSTRRSDDRGEGRGQDGGKNRGKDRGNKSA